MNYRIRLLETEESWSVSCLDLPGCHSQGTTRGEATIAIKEAIELWLEVEAEENGIKSAETFELTVCCPSRPGSAKKTPSVSSKKLIFGQSASRVMS